MSPKTFISYSHDSRDHQNKVLDLSDRLRNEGVDCHIDQYLQSPEEGWPRWMEKQIESARFVLVICTEEYHLRFQGKRETSLGTTWEGAIISQELYEAQGTNKKFIPVIFASSDTENIPKVLRPFTYYDLSKDERYDNLYRHLTGQPEVVKPSLGKVRSLPVLNRVQDFPPIGATPRGQEFSGQLVDPSDDELEFQILQRYADHFDEVMAEQEEAGTRYKKCDRELDMGTVIEKVTGWSGSKLQGALRRWHGELVATNPADISSKPLRSCSNSEINRGPHRWHGRAYDDETGVPARSRLRELRRELERSTPSLFVEENAYGEPKVSPADIVRKAAVRKANIEDELVEKKLRKEIFEQEARKKAPTELGKLVSLLREGVEKTTSAAAAIPDPKYDSVNNQHQIGMLGIGLSPVSNSEPFRVSVWAGCHPNAAQSHAKLPEIDPFQQTFFASADEGGFSWIDKENGSKLQTEEVVEKALEYLATLVVKFYIDKDY